MSDEPKKLIFVSHAPSDEEYVQAFVDLLEDLGLHEDEIVCSSLAPYNEPLSEGVYRWLTDVYPETRIYVMYMLSHNYYSSVSCLNEMGATWAMKYTWMTFLMPAFDFEEIEGCIQPAQAGIKLDNPDRETLCYLLDKLRVALTGAFQLRSLSSAVWERKRDGFVQKIATLADVKHQLEFAAMMSADPEDSVENAKHLTLDSCLMLVYADSNPSGQITMSTDMVGITFAAGHVRFNRDESAEEVAKWRSALDTLEKLGLVRLVDRRDMVYELTPRGHRFAEEARNMYQIDTSRSPEEYLSQEA